MRKQEIDRIIGAGKKFNCRRLSAFIMTDQGDGLRAAYIVSKKLGNAVNRNRIRRLLRESFRLISKQINRNADFVFLPRKTVFYASLNEIKQEIEEIFTEAGLLS